MVVGENSGKAKFIDKMRVMVVGKGRGVGKRRESNSEGGSQVRTRGFTIVEMLAVMALMALVGTLTLSGYREMNRRQQLRNAGLQLMASLVDVRGRAVAGVKRCQDGCQVGLVCGDLDDYPLDWWGVVWGSVNGLDTANYEYKAACGEVAGNPEFPQEQANKTVCGFEGGVCFLNPTSGRVRFEAVTGKVLEGSGVVELCGGGRVYQIGVEASGRMVDMGMESGVSCGDCTDTSQIVGCGNPIWVTPTVTLTPTPTPTATLTPTPTPTVTLTPTPTPVVLEVRVSTSGSGYDDAEEEVTSRAVNLTSSDLEMTQESDVQIVGVRFRSIAVPQGTNIKKAYIQFTVDETDSVLTNLTVRGQAVDNAGIFTSASGDISGRMTTAAAVSWNNIPAWNTVGESGPNERTADISPVIEEIVGRPGWVSGNSLVVIITGTGKRVAESVNGSSSQAALLHIEY
jgi:prepilin-type N-terminal cleavage/methylation domain-containing protein